MRVTNQTMTDNAIQYMNDNLSRLNELQLRVSSGKNFQNSSDNPSGVSAALSLRSTIKTNETYINTIQNSTDWMSATEYSLGQMIDVATRAKVLSEQGLSDTLSGKERSAALGTEIDGLLGQAIQIGNANHQGNYIFSGFQILTKPFALNASGNSVDSLDGFGNPLDTSGKLQREIGPNQTITINVDGNAAFSSLFQALIDVRNALNGNNTANLQTAITSLNTSLDGVVQVRTSVGARQRQLQTSADRMDKTQLQLKSLLSQKEDTNMAEAISLMSNQETVYKTVLEVGQRAISALNLFDYLR